MCLTLGIVEPKRALLLSDGFVTNANGVVCDHFSKIFRLPSGDRLLVTGTGAAVLLARQLQADKPLHVHIVATRIRIWCSTHRGGGTFRLIGRNANKLWLWMSDFRDNKWVETVEDFSVTSEVIATASGVLDDDHLWEALCLFAKRLNIPGRTFEQNAADARETFRVGYLSAPGRIGGTIFEDQMIVGEIDDAPDGGYAWEEFKGTRNCRHHFVEIESAGDGTRCAFHTNAQRDNAVDASGNLLFKNIAQGVASTAGPTTTSNTPSVIPEMSQTVTTKGNKVLVVFNGTFQVSVLAGLLSIYLYRDGSSIGYLNLTSAPGASFFFPSSISWIDQPAAGSHTYDVRWTISSGTATAVGTDRALQVVELG